MRREPVGPHDVRRLALLHPEDWRNLAPADRYHLVVVGAGTAGLVTAAIAVALGARVALVERHLMGGDCLNVGCVPSKAMLAAARAWKGAREAAERFGGPAASGPGDFAAAMERMRALRADIAPIDGAPRYRDLGVDVFLGDGRFVAEDALEVAGARLHFRRAVIATGGRPATPEVPGLEEAGYLTNETVFDLTRLPERLAVVGGGPIGCELAQAFARFGARVTLLERGERLLPADDPEAAEIVARALAADGVEVVTGATVRSAARAEGGRLVRYEAAGATVELACDEILVAAGRAPNVEGLGLEAAGVRAGEKGVEVDDRMRTANSRIYAIGDVASRFRFTHAADAQARMVVRNALFHGRAKASSLVIPWCTYTSPEVAHVGLTAREAAERADEVDTITVPMREVDRARLDGATAGFLRVHLRRGSDDILGATLVGEHAGDLLTPVTVAMTSGLGLSALGAAVYPYPTLAEVVRKAADAHSRTRLTPTAKRAFAAFFRVVR